MEAVSVEGADVSSGAAAGLTSGVTSVEGSGSAVSLGSTCSVVVSGSGLVSGSSTTYPSGYSYLNPNFSTRS